MLPARVLLVDIDGLRPDVFQDALAAGKLPNLARMLGRSPLENSLFFDTTAPAPSITFCSQASLFTGAHPAAHGIPGNQFFDRFGTNNNGVPRHYAFDVGDTLAVDDAVRVFTDSLAADRLSETLVYDRLSRVGKSSIVAGNMYGRGADRWIKPGLTNLARFTKGGNLFGLSSRAYDEGVLNKLLDALHKDGLPDLLTVYFMGLDHDSHKYGPTKGQAPYLINHVDPMLGELWEQIESLSENEKLPLVVVFSDHGQIEVVPDDRHSLRIGFPFDKEMGYFFEALGLDVHDYPGEDPNCDAVMALNGGLAFVYLHHSTGKWSQAPDFERDVLPVGQAFWEAHQTGRYAADLQGALAGVLLRNTAAEGWNAGYQALTPGGEQVSLANWFETQPAGLYLDPVNRLDNMAGIYAGDLLLIANYADGFYFGSEISGVHGGLHPDDSRAVLAYGWPGASAANWGAVRTRISEAIQARCAAEGHRLPTTADMLIGALAGLGWKLP
jgi:hypothetical protein